MPPKKAAGNANNKGGKAQPSQKRTAPVKQPENEADIESHPDLVFLKQKMQEAKSKELAKRREEIKKKQQEGYEKSNPFFTAVMHGDAVVLEELLNKSALLNEDQLSIFPTTRVVNIPGLDMFPALRQIDQDTGNTLLHYGAMTNVAICEVLLRLGMNPFVNARNKAGCSPIFLAVGQGKLDVVKFLVEHGANLQIPTTAGGSILHAAVLTGNYDIVRYLLTLPQLETNVDDDEFMTPFGMALIRIGETQKTCEEVRMLIKETILDITTKTTQWVIDENEKIDARREELGLNNDDDVEDAYDAAAAQEARIKKAKEAVTAATLGQGATNDANKKQDNKKNGNNKNKKVAADEEEKNKPQQEIPADLKFITFEEQQELIAEALKDHEALTSLRQSLDRGEAVLASFKKIADILMNPPVFQLTVPESERVVERLVPSFWDENKSEQENTEIMARKLAEVHDDMDTFYTLYPEKKITRVIKTGGKVITHAPERAKIIHFPPYVSYWMLLIETQDLDLIKTCLERCDVDVNWRFDLGKRVKNATALHYAIDLENMDLVKLLVEVGGADLSAEMLLKSEMGDGMEPQQPQSQQEGEEEEEEGNNNKQRKAQQPAVQMNRDDGYEMLIDMVNDIYSRLYFIINNTTASYKDFLAVVNDDTKFEQLSDEQKAKFTKYKKILQLLQPQQGFTPFIAALYNKQPEMAQYLLKRGGVINFGKTYLKTHNVQPKPQLLTADLLDAESNAAGCTGEDDKTLLAQQQELLNRFNNPKSALPLLKKFQDDKYAQIGDVQQLLTMLFPYLAAPLSQILAPQIEAHRDDYEAKMAKLNVHSPQATEQDKLEYEALSHVINGYHSSMVPDALRIAINHGYDDLVYQLLRLGADIDSPYFFAKAEMTQVNPEVAESVGYDYSLTVQINDVGYTPLYAALQKKNTDVVKQLLTLNADINSSLYTHLLARGVDLNQSYILPLMSNVDDKDDKFNKKVQVIFFNKTPAVPPIVSAIQHHPDTLHMLVRHNPYILRHVTSELRNVLHYTAELNKPVASTYILSNDVSVLFQRDRYGMTPLSFGVAQDNHEIVALFCGLMKKYHLLPTYHPQRQVHVNVPSSLLLDFEQTYQYYNALDNTPEMLPFYPHRYGKSSKQDNNNNNNNKQNSEEEQDNTQDDDVVHFDDIDADPDVEEQALKKQSTTTTAVANKDKPKPYWVDQISDKKKMIFNPNGFDSITFTAYQRQMMEIYQPIIAKSMAGPESDESLTFTTFHPEYNVEEFNPATQQLQTDPLRWLGFDIACANYLSMYYQMVNNPKVEEKLAKIMQPIVEKIDGVYGHMIRAYRLAGMTGSMLSLRILNNLFCIAPQVEYNEATIKKAENVEEAEAVIRPYILTNQQNNKKQFRKYNLWVELVVPSEEELATRICSVGGYQLLANNVVVDPHGFIVRNVTYEYAATMYKHTLRHGIISPSRLCLPLRSYLATELLSTISKEGSAAMMMESLSKQALPLLHGLNGVTFIRAFHQFYICNPLMRTKATGEFNLDGVIENRVPSLPFTSFQKDDIYRVAMQPNPLTLLYKQKQKEQTKTTAATDNTQPVDIYKVPSYSPLHLAVANDQLPVVRLLIGLTTNPDQNEEEEEEDGEQEENQEKLKDMLENTEELQTPTTTDIEAHKKQQKLYQIEDNTSDDPIFGKESPLLDTQINMKTLQELVQMLSLEEFYQQQEPQDGTDATQQGNLGQDMAPMNGTNTNDATNNNNTKQQQQQQKTVRLPPLLHIPLPNDPIFQLINRCAVQTVDMPDPSNPEEVKKVDTIIHPLHLCALNDLVDVGEVLIQYGAIVDVPDHDGNTPLHLAIRDCSRLFTDALLNYNANVNVQNKNGDTPIHVAIQCGFTSVAKIMIDNYKGDVTIKNNNGESVADLLAKREELEAQGDIYGEIQHENKMPTFEQLRQSQHDESGFIEDDKGNKFEVKPDLSKMSPEEKRRYNQRQIALLRKELELLQQKE